MKNFLNLIKNICMKIIVTFLGKCRLNKYYIDAFWIITSFLKNNIKKIMLLLLEYRFLFIFFFIIIIFFFLDLNFFFNLNLIIPEDPQHNKVILPNEIFDFNVLKSNGKIIITMLPEYPTTIIISEMLYPHKINSVTYMELLDFFYNEMLVNNDFFETDLTIIELYEIVVSSNVNYFYYYYYYYLFCFKLLNPKEFYLLIKYLDYSRIPSVIGFLRDKFLVQRKRKFLFFVLKQGLDLIKMVKEKKKK